MKTSNVQPASRKATAGKQAFVRQRPDCGAAIAQLTLAFLSTSQLSRDLGNITVQANDVAAAREYFEEALKLEPNGEYAQEAKEALRKLKKK